MLTHEQIVKAVEKVASKFLLNKVLYFGSYADGKATEKSDLDLLVEFGDDGSLTLLDIVRLERILKDELNVHVDVVEIPLVKTSMLIT